MSVQINALKDTEVFEPIQVGRNKLAHKVVFAPSTRVRSLPDHTPSDLNYEYYSERTKIPGSYVIVEGTFVSEGAGGLDHVPGIWNKKHIKGWKKITDEAHNNGAFIGLQGWFLGRVADPSVLKKSGQKFIAPSAIYIDKESEKAAIEANNSLHAVTVEEIKELIYTTYTNAAKNAIEAGFDYFEIHSAHGYFLDQFLHPVSNQRNDNYGGSVENRARFLLELVDQLTKVVGADRLAVRLSPWTTRQGILSINDEIHPVTTYSYILHELQKRANEGQKLAYVSIVEPRVNVSIDKSEDEQFGSNDFALSIWKGVFLRSGSYSYDAPSFKTLLNDIQGHRTLVGFSRYYLSNPDLPQRLHDGISLTPYDRDTFYSQDNWGYNTFNRAGKEIVFDKNVESNRIGKEIGI